MTGGGLPPEVLAGGEEPFSDDDLDVVTGLVEANGQPGETLPQLMERSPWLFATTEAVTVVRWGIGDLSGAQWAAARWAQADADVAEAEEQYAEWKLRLDGWLADTARRARRTREFFAGHLERYALGERERTGKATLRLPSATVGTTHHAAKAAVGKEDELLAWAADNAPELLRREVAKSAFNARVAVGQTVDHYEHHLELSCGHSRVVLTPAGDEGAEDWRAIETAVCLACTDLVDDMGEPVRQPVASGRTEVITRPAVVDRETGEVVPGAVVEPEQVTAKVRRA